MVQCCGTIFPTKQRSHNRCRISNTNLSPLAFHAFYWIVLIPCNILFIFNTFFICKAVPLRLQNNAKETRFLWIHSQIYNPAWKRHITSGRDYVALPPAIFTCTNLNTLFVTHIIVNIIYYYSFRIFPRFWLVKTTRTIHHNQLLFTKFGKNLRHIESMTSKVQPAENYWTNDVKMTSKAQPAADYWIDDREKLGTRLCYIWWAEKQRAKWRNSFENEENILNE